MPQYYISSSKVGPVGRVLAAILAAAVILGVVVFGFLVLAVAAAAGVLLWIVFSIRAWWLRRTGAEESPKVDSRQSEVIDAEYTVISRRRDSEKERH